MPAMIKRVIARAKDTSVSDAADPGARGEQTRRDIDLGGAGIICIGVVELD